MSPFRWPSPAHDIALAKEFAARKPNKPDEWDRIASLLSQQFSTSDKKVVISGRSCKDRLRRLLETFKEDDKKSLKK